MMPQKGQYVKVIFRNSTQVEGFVDEWSNVESTLRAEDGKSFLVIMNTSLDVMAIKIMNVVESPTKTKEKFQELEKEFQEVYQQPSTDELRLKKLAQLRIAMNEQEKKIISDKMKDHVPSGTVGVKYGNIFSKK